MACFNPKPATRIQGGRMKLLPNNAGGREWASHWLPCGKCLGCRDNQAAEWTIRLKHETRLHSHNTFLTITYDDENEPTGLSIPDLQKFWKRLRKKYNIKYFACGEYGDKTKRPHYHAAVFGIDKIGDEKKWDLDNDESKTLTDIWGMGRVLKSELTPPRIAYVTGYVLKKAGYQKQIYCDEDAVVLQNPFRKMSTGLGKDWLNKYDTDLRHGYIQSEKRKQAIPRYYLDKLKKINPQLLQQIQETRDQTRQERPMPDKERNKAAQAIREQQVKKAKRNKI